jgi:hypothetical protein
MFLSGSSGLVKRLVEQWQLGAIFGWTSGAPLDITAPISTITQVNSNMPVILGDFPKSMGVAFILDIRSGGTDGLAQWAEY